MARIARVVARGLPHHLTHRGNRRQETFFSKEDYEEYLRLMSEWCFHWRVAVWAYCLMPNHVHMIVVPKSEEGLRRAVGEAHRRYTRRVNFREGWRGHLWQGIPVTPYSIILDALKNYWVVSYTARSQGGKRG